MYLLLKDAVADDIICNENLCVKKTKKSICMYKKMKENVYSFICLC